MRDEPTAADLLATALAVFRERLLPALPKELKYEALMVSNAMAISSRQIGAGDEPLAEAHARLRALYGQGSLEDLERRLAKDIREGRLDPGVEGHDEAWRHLYATSRDKAAESSPKALQGRRPEDWP